MIYVLIPVLVILMGLTLFSLMRGLNAFRQTLDSNIDPEGAMELRLKQNRMMWARIKFQGAAIIIVVLLLTFAGGH